MITYKHRPIGDFVSLVYSFGDAALASPYRSTVPFLTYWKALDAKVPDFAAALDVKLTEPMQLAFEYTVPAQRGKRQSFTYRPYALGK